MGIDEHRLHNHPTPGPTSPAYVDRTPSRGPAVKERVEKRRVCPVCPGLECQCRPRYFAGQLLTEEELNAEQQYVIKKNRLHNLYLHGSGVVCGLEVVCHPNCEGWVRVG